MITIVSGLPRCGTSLMMRMLQFGGMSVLADDVRRADEDNPLGYYELEDVKKVGDDATFLQEAEGKVFKMVSRLLFDLPKDRQYKVVFMKRDMSEMIASQNKMLQRQNKPLAPDDEETRQLFQRHLDGVEAWLAEQKDMKVIYVVYNHLLSSPDDEISRLCTFLELDLDRARMKAAIDVGLYRQRSSTPA